MKNPPIYCLPEYTTFHRAIWWGQVRYLIVTQPPSRYAIFDENWGDRWAKCDHRPRKPQSRFVVSQPMISRESQRIFTEPFGSGHFSNTSVSPLGRSGPTRVKENFVNWYAILCRVGGRASHTHRQGERVAFPCPVVGTLAVTTRLHA